MTCNHCDKEHPDVRLFSVGSTSGVTGRWTTWRIRLCPRCALEHAQGDAMVVEVKP